MMKMVGKRSQSYPAGAAMTTAAAHQEPIVAVDVAWVMEHGSRAQRRRVRRELSRLVVAGYDRTIP